MKRTKITASIITLLLVGAVGAACSNTPDRTGTEAITTAEELTEAKIDTEASTEAKKEAETATEATTEAKTETENETEKEKEVTSEAGSELKTDVEISDTDKLILNISSNDEDDVQLIEVEFPDGADKVTFTSDAKFEKNGEDGVYSVYLNETDDNAGIVEIHLDTKTVTDGE